MASAFRAGIKRGFSAAKFWYFSRADSTRRQRYHTQIFLYGTRLAHFFQLNPLPQKLNPTENPISIFYCDFLAPKFCSTSTSAKLEFPEGTYELPGAESDENCEFQSENEHKPEETEQEMENSASEEVSSGEESEEASAESSAAAVNQSSSPLDLGNRKNKPKRSLEKIRKEICQIVEKDDKDMEESLNQLGIHITTGFLSKIFSNLTSPKAAVRFFEWAKNQPGFKHKSVTYDELVNVVGRSKDFETLQMLFAQRLNVGCINSAKTFSFATVWDDDPALLNKVIEIIKNLEDFQRRDAYDKLIAAFCKENYVDVAMSVLQAMLSIDCAPILRTFHPFILAYCRNNQFDKVHEIFQVMKEGYCSPDTTCYNHVLSSLCQKKRFAEAAEFLRTMVNSSSGKPDPVTYDILILGATKRGKMEGALRLFSRMKEDGFKPLYTTYTHIICGFLRAGEFDKAYLFVNRESGKDHNLDARNYALFVKVCSKLGRVKEAYNVLMEMKAKDLNPDRRLCSQVIRKNKLIQTA